MDTTHVLDTLNTAAGQPRVDNENSITCGAPRPDVVARYPGPNTNNHNLWLRY